MWQNQVVEEVRKLKIIKGFSVGVDKDGQYMEFVVLPNNNEADKFQVRPNPKYSKYFIVNFSKDSRPRRTFKKLTLQEVRTVSSMYCTNREKKDG